MNQAYITENIVQFRETNNPIYLAKAFTLILAQKRAFELTYGIFCNLFCRPSVVNANAAIDPQKILNSCLFLLSSKHILSRRDLIDIFNTNYAIHALPADFAGARMESIVCDRNFLIIGEYGTSAKRIFYITKTASNTINHYINNNDVNHIHAIYKAKSSEDILITTGDTIKIMDLWHLRNDQLIFTRRLKNRMAGYTAMTKIGDYYYFGTDFSSRPNYIQKFGGKKYFYPKKAYKMYVVSFHQHLNRYLVSINKELSVAGGRETISIFDTVLEEYVFCEYLDHIQLEMAGKLPQCGALARADWLQNLGELP